MTMPPSAVTADACPDGKALLCSSASGFCHDGRSRPTSDLDQRSSTSGVTIITPAVKNAAAVVAAQQHRDEHDRVRRHRDRAERDLDDPQHVVQPGDVGRPLLRRLAAVVDVDQPRGVVDDGEGEQPEEHEAERGPAQDDGAGTVEHAPKYAVRRVCRPP